MKKRKVLKVVLGIFVIVLGLNTLTTISAEDKEVRYLDIVGNGIVLTQEEAKTLTKEEIIEKANIKTFDNGIEVPVEITNIKIYKNPSIATLEDILAGSFNYDKVPFDQDDIDEAGMFCYIHISAEDQDGKMIYMPSRIKMVVLGSDIAEYNGNTIDEGITYVKRISGELILTNTEYKSLIIKIMDGGNPQWELSDILQAMGYFEVVPHINYLFYPDTRYAPFEIHDESKKEFNKFMDLDYAGGKVTLTFKNSHEDINYKPSININVLPGEAPKEAKPAKPTAPSTGDSKNTPLLASLLLASGLIAMYAIKKARQ